MIKNKRAQIMTLDIVLSIVLIILIFFLLFNVVESRINQNNTDRINKELNYIGDLSFINITNNSLINCYANDTQNNYHIPSCLALNDSFITKKNLGLPSNYKCNLTGAAFTTNECNDVFNPNINYFYSIDFNVSILNDRELSKYNYVLSYKSNNTDLDNIQELNLKVWR